ncbi:MAG: TIGR00266 family protein [Candidatus Sericytochromatia bacterium]|nr:TIGR00266 family protein [Candidatus Sericytochromatia bacterium]
MKTTVVYPGTNSMIRVDLQQGEKVKAESNAMVVMSTTIDLEGKLEGGLMAGLGRMMAGEKFFFQTLSANRGSGYALLAPSTPGDVFSIELDGSIEYNVQKDGFLAGSDTIQVNTKMQNLSQGLLSGEGFFILKVSGKGTLVLSSFGAIHEVNLSAGEEYTIDNAHLVAWPTTTSYRIDKASKGWFSSFTSGEGLVCKFTGPGKVYIQTRNSAAFGSWIQQFVRK